MSDIKNPLLQQASQAILAKVPQQLQPVVLKVVESGKKVMYAPETRAMLEKQLAGPGDPAEKAGAGAAKLFALLFNRSKHTIPMQAGAPAGAMLLCEALDFLEQGHQVEVTPDVLAAATQAYGSNLLQLLGVDPSKLQGMVSPSEAPAAAAPAQSGIIATAQGA